jgi:hypothetical protein
MSHPRAYPISSTNHSVSTINDIKQMMARAKSESHFKSEEALTANLQ